VKPLLVSVHVAVSTKPPTMATGENGYALSRACHLTTTMVMVK